MSRYKPYPAYKDSGVEWLGKVPEHWDVKAIKWLSPVQRGASPRPIDDPKYFDDENGEYGWVRIEDVSSSDGILLSTKQKLSTLGSSLSVKLETGSLFLSIAGTVGKPCVTQIKACIHDGFVYFPYLAINPSWFYKIFESRTPFVGLGKLGTQLNLNTETVGGINISIPPAQEVERILGHLDRETARIDALISKKTRFIELLREKRQALITQAVTKGLDPNVKMKDSGVEWLGEVPEHWEVKPIKWLSPVQRGASPRPIDDPKYFDDDGKHGWVRIEDVTSSGGYLKETKQKLSELGSSLSVKLPIGSLFLSIAGTVGRPCISLVDACIHDGFVYFPLLMISPEWLFRVFECKTPFVGLGKMGTQLNLNTETVGGIFVGLPPAEEIQNILEVMKERLTRIDTIIGRSERSIELLKERRSALITAAVTGQIDLREAA